MMRGNSHFSLVRLLVTMVLVAALAGACAWLFSSTMPPRYEARALLLRAPLWWEKTDESLARLASQLLSMASSGLHVGPPPTDFVKSAMPESLPMPDYMLLFCSEDMAERLRERVAQYYAEAGIAVPAPSMGAVRGSMQVQARVHLQTQFDVQYQHVVELTYSSEFPEIAARAANDWAQWCAELANQTRQAGRAGVVDMIREKLNTAQAHWDELAAQLEASSVVGTAEGLALQAEALETALAEQGVKVLRDKAELARLEAEAAAWQDACRGVSPEAMSAIQPRIAEAVARLAGARAELAAADQIRAELDSALEPVCLERARLERERARLQLQLDAQARSVGELTLTLRSAEMAASDTAPGFEIAARAHAPSGPASPRRTLLSLSAAFLAALLVPLQFFGAHAMRRMAQETASEQA